MTFLEAVWWTKEHNPGLVVEGLDAAALGVVGRGGMVPTMIFDRVRLVGLIGDEKANRHLCLVRRSPGTVEMSVGKLCRHQDGNRAFDEALLGYSYRPYTLPCAVYDADIITAQFIPLMADNEHETAVEQAHSWFGQYVYEVEKGEGAPLFLTKIEHAEDKYESG